tara:strand:- start:1100 stop:1462 length:363 start_codon:yes stop_codon:yes gene_type:complete
MKNLNVIVKRFDKPDEVSHFDKGVFETIKINGTVIGRATYEPGWKWSKHVGPKINKDYCDVEHLGMVISGQATAASPNGEITVFKPGDIFYVPKEDHDSWVVGDEPYVSLHFLGADKYTK